MRPLPHEGPAEEGLSCSLLRLVHSDQQLRQLREELSGYTHRCRNLLNGMKMGFYFVRRGAEQPLPEWWDGLERNYRGIEELLDQLQMIYRPITLSLVRSKMGCLIQDRQRIWSDWFGSGCGTLDIARSPLEESAGEFDPMCLTMGFDALARWRAAALSPGQSAQLSWGTRDGQFEVSWIEHAGKVTTVDRPQTSSVAGSSSPWSARQPLALPLLARVMTAHRGTMEWGMEPQFHTRLRWPLNLSEQLNKVPV